MERMMEQMKEQMMEQWIIESKRSLLTRIPDVETRMKQLDEWLGDEISAIRAASADGSGQLTGSGIIPEIGFRDLAGGLVSGTTRDLIRRRGCVIIRGVFERELATEWNERIGRYIDRNDYFSRAGARAGLDQYFSSLAAGRPQIFGLYWSVPQIEARQHPHLDLTRRFLNNLWDCEAGEDGAPEFDPDQQFNYADRLRRREPGDRSLGLSPHCDGGSIERWCDPGYQRVYEEVFFGKVENYDPFRAAGRTGTSEIPSPAVCSVFRTFQGWTGLTAQGPGDGTLRLIPIAGSMAWILLRALQPDVAPDDLCGVRAGRALAIDAKRHAKLLEAEVTIPRVEPGDTVWWHPDVIHAVENEHCGREYSNVIYIGAVPRCGKNADFMGRQATAFLSGRSCPDFAHEDFEVDFEDRARLEDLTPLGLAQMGLAVK